MTVTSVERDAERLTLTITAEFEAPIEAVWQLWENPRLLEQWWGPPMYPATFVDHDFAPGGGITYFMTSPEGDRYQGWWRVITLEAPKYLEFEDGFADDAGNPNPEMPTSIIRVTIAELSENAARMAVETTFSSIAAMEQLLAMGMDEGMAAAMGQIPDILRTAVTST